MMMILLAALDQGIKILVRATLTSRDMITIVPNFVYLTHQENEGISFSFMSELPDGLRIPLLAGMSLVVMVGLGVYMWKKYEELGVWERWGYATILGGALGNLIDRAFRHSVTDYMYLQFFGEGLFINNFADDLISLGFLLVLAQGFINMRNEKKEKHEGADLD